MFYVYEWYIKDTGEIFYVGKGCGKRYKVAYQRNQLFTNTIQQYDCESRIIKYFNNEKDAFQYEDERINQLKKQGLCKCNIHSGGAGGSSEYWTDQLRQEYSINNPMKDPEQRKRMAEQNPMKNKQTVQKVVEKKSKKIIINNIQYPSIKAVKEHYNVSYDVVIKWCKNGITSFGEQCRYADPTQATINKKQNHNVKPIIVDGVRYNSCKEASEKLKIGKSTLYSYLRGEVKNPKYICVYDNQQPSQGNFNNSTLEGSTTNR